MKFQSLRKISMVAVLAAAGLVLAQADFATAKARSMPAHAMGGVNVSVNFTMNLPLSDTSDQAVSATQKRGRTFIYTMASEECAVLLKTIAATCRLTSLNVSARVQDRNYNRPVTLYLNGSSRYAITLKGKEVAPARKR